MIFVTGATGFVGANLLERLINDGHRVRALIRRPQAAGSVESKGCESVIGDVRDAQSLLTAITPPVDTVIHLVGVLFETKGASFNEMHLRSTVNVINACLKKGVKRYIHISALGTRKDARSSYHRTKWAAEEAVRSSGLDYTIFRPSVIFGRQDKFTNLFANIIKNSPVVFVPGSGRNKMQPVFIDDVVSAIAASVKADWASGMTYEIGGKEAYAFDEIIDLIAAAINRTRLKVHVPMPLMRVAAGILEGFLSRPPITRDQLLMLEEDNVTDAHILSSVFGITPRSFADGMKTYLT
ncbi:MAG: hypothetical protein A3J24_00925 [Deltaproteobacteria bacterium RIFCSPLOWO2_02_FULL_53_8]|nr:MAG: hypothetical protein A3J24_00925 [Deltaproteobacteria bacterium RIFCSPLOWO2_02_FULL_53_8]